VEEQVYFIPEKTNVNVFEFISNVYDAEDEDEEEDQERPYYDNCFIGNGNKETDIFYYSIGARDFYISKEKIDSIQSFCKGGLLGNTRGQLCHLLSREGDKKKKEEFSYTVFRDPQLIYKLGDINFFLQYGESNLQDIEFITFNMETKFDMAYHMTRNSFYCTDVCHANKHRDTDCPRGEECDEVKIGQKELYDAFVQIYFYKFQSYYHRPMENPGFQHYIFDTNFSIPYCSTTTSSDNNNNNNNIPDKMVYFKISFVTQDPFPDRDHYGDGPFFYFEFKVRYSMVDINDEVVPCFKHEFQTLYIRDENKNKPQADESFMDGLRKSFNDVFPNFKFDIILLLKLFKLDLYVIFDFQKNKKICKHPYLQLRLYSSSENSIFEFAEEYDFHTNISSCILEENGSCEDDAEYNLSWW